MVFSSLTFLFAFFPLFLAIYFVLPDKYKNFVLFVFSLLFYAWGEPVYILLMLFSTVFDFTNGLLIEKFGPKTIKSKMFMLLKKAHSLQLLPRYSSL